MSPDTSRPLRGITVLDLSRILAGPYCTMLLGDLGAEILKVEPPGGDDCRHWGPPFVAGESSYFLSVNRNKKSLCLDLKQEAGRKVLERLIPLADVLVENFRPGTLDRLGFGYDALKRERPRLVYCSISGYGQTGPYRERPGYDAIMQGEAGWMSLTGPSDGAPHKIGASLADIFTGMMAGQGILAALYRREATGQGERVDVALYDSVMATLCYQAQSYLMTGEVPERIGNRHPSLAPYETFETRDGYVIVGVGNDGLWRRLVALLDHPELGDERFARNADRVRGYRELEALLRPLFRNEPTQQWIDRLTDAGIPVGKVRSLDEVFAHPQVAARRMRLEVEHPTVGRLSLTGNPIKISETQGREETETHDETLPPPLLGQHNAEVLSERLGMDSDEIRSLEERGVLGS